MIDIEAQYLDLLYRLVHKAGEPQENRTGINTYKLHHKIYNPTPGRPVTQFSKCKS